MRASISLSKPPSGRPKARDRLDQRRQRPDGRRRSPTQRLAPPLQADLAEHRARSTVSRTRATSALEGVQREEVLARVVRREQVGEVAVAIALHASRARRGHRRPCLTDMAAAARFSPPRINAAATGPLLGEQHIEGANGRAGGHRLGDDPGRAAALAKRGGQRHQLAPGADEQDLDRVGFVENAASGWPRRVPRRRRVPAVNAARQAEQRRRDATCRRSESRHCRKRRSARGQDSGRRG